MSEQQKVAQDFVMSKNSLILVLQNKQENSTIAMAKMAKHGLILINRLWLPESRRRNPSHLLEELGKMSLG